MMRRFVLTMILVAAMAVIDGCASRYRLNLLVSEEGTQRNVKVEQTQIIKNTVLGEPLSDEKIKKGIGTCLIVTGGTRGARQEKNSIYEVLQYDEYIKYQMYFQLPCDLRTGSLPLIGMSFVTILGRYELPVEATTFTPATGTIVVDSMTHGKLFATVKGEFKNDRGGTLNIDGKFKARTEQ